MITSYSPLPSGPNILAIIILLDNANTTNKIWNKKVDSDSLNSLSKFDII